MRDEHTTHSALLGDSAADATPVDLLMLRCTVCDQVMKYNDKLDDYDLLDV